MRVPAFLCPAPRLLLAVFVVAAFVSCKRDTPLIHTLEPSIGATGETLTIDGERFGDEREDSYVTIAGTPPVSSSYLAWTDTRISFVIPEFGSTGLLYVHRHGKRSNPLLFANRATLPELTQESGELPPLITSMSPASATVGSLISIQGSFFGAARENGGVFFPWAGQGDEAGLIQATDYELWNDHEIRARVPDGAASGNVEIHTSSGDAITGVAAFAETFTVTAGAGTKTFTDRRQYRISYSVDVKTEQATVPNILYLWLPTPVSSASQRNVSLLERNGTPFAEDYQGTMLFQLSDLKNSATSALSLSYSVDVYTIETTINASRNIAPPSSAPPSSALPSSVPAAYTLSTALIPSGDQRIISLKDRIIGREQNPYENARKIYEWLLAEGNIQGGSLYNTALEALEQQSADAWSASLLFCALARAAGIPAIPVTGVLVTRSRTAAPHCWAEFWLDGIGWIPLDPALGAGSTSADLASHADPSTYYLGNVDNQRIAFSRGETTLSQMDPRGRAAGYARSYSLQTFWEEAIGGLALYTTRWSDVRIIDIQ
jgi:transglutaminase-like putative cysteine protease